jgi:hypothetical protein
VTVVDEPENVSGSIEDRKARNSSSELLALKEGIADLSKTESRIEDLLRKMANIDNAWQGLKKIEVSSAYAYKLHRTSSS